MNHLSDEQLNEYLDHAAADRAKIDAHLADCHDCSVRLSTMRNLFAEIESLPEMQLTRDIAEPLARTLGRARALPRWLTLTVLAQAALAVFALLIAGPFVLSIAQTTSIPALQLPSLAAILLEVQQQWTAWLDLLSQSQIPALPAIPGAFDISSVYLLLAAAGTAICWLIGNGLMLRRTAIQNRAET